MPFGWIARGVKVPHFGAGPCSMDRRTVEDCRTLMTKLLFQLLSTVVNANFMQIFFGWRLRLLNAIMANKSIIISPYSHCCCCWFCYCCCGCCCSCSCCCCCNAVAVVIIDQSPSLLFPFKLPHNSCAVWPIP